jgi:predicted acetyltransferase
VIKVLINPQQNEINKFESFASANWGEHNHDQADSKNDFYDLQRIIFECYEDSNLVSGLVVFIKTLIFKNKIINFAGIGGVVTHLEKRKMGYATKTLNYALKYLKKRKVSVALLCTDIKRLGNLYSKVGFVELKKKYYFLNSKDQIKFEKEGMICKLYNPDDFNFILKTKEKIFTGRSNF